MTVRMTMRRKRQTVRTVRVRAYSTMLYEGMMPW